MNIMQLIQTVRSAQNPREFLRAQAQRNPTIARALQMTDGKNAEEIMQVARNLAESRGVDLSAVRQSLGL